MNVVEIKVKATAEGLTGEIKTEVDSAIAAAGDAKVKLRADITGTAQEVSAGIAEMKAYADSAGVALSIKAKVDPDEASAVSAHEKLERTVGDVKVKVTMDDAEMAFARLNPISKKAGDDSGRSFGQAFGDAFGGFGAGSGGVFAGIGRFISSPAGIGAALPIVGSLVTSLESLLGLLPLIGAGFAGAAIGVGTMVVGFHGVIDTLGEFQKASDASLGKTAQLAAQQLAASNSLVSADQAVRQARQSLGDTERNVADQIVTARRSIASAALAASQAVSTADRDNEAAADSLQSAIESLQSAEQSETRATNDLASAKQAASRAIEDANNKVIDSQNAHLQAVHDLADAQATLNAPSTGQPGRDMIQLALNVQTAQQRVIETQQAWDRAGEDAATANQKGVDGSRQVVSAQDAVIAAQKQVRDATQAVADARDNVRDTAVRGDQAIADADQRLADSRAAFAKAELTGDEQIRKSKEAVTTALRAQEQAVAQSKATAESAAGSLSTFNAELAKLSPNAQDAVLALLGLRSQWSALQQDTQNHLFADAGEDIRRIGAVFLPVLRSGLVSVADGIDANVRAFAAWLTSASAVSSVGELFKNVGSAIAKLAPAIGPVMSIITDLITVGSEFLPGLADGFAKTAQGAADFVRNARDTGQLKTWVQSGIDTLRDLWNIVKDIAVVFHDFTSIAFPGGLIHDLSDLIAGLRWLMDNIPGLTYLIEAFFAAWGLVKLVGMIGGVVEAIKEWTAVQWSLDAAMDANPIGIVILAAAAFAAAAYEIIKNWGPISGFFAELGRGISDAFWGSIHWIEDRFNDFIGFMNSVGRVLWTIGTQMWDGLVAGAKGAVNGVIILLNGMIDGINTLIHGANWVSFGTVHISDIPHIPSWRAAGGPSGGLTILGEQGPELVRLPSGSQVMPAANTATALRQGAQDAHVHLHWDLPGGSSAAETALFNLMRNGIRTRGGISALTS